MKKLIIAIAALHLANCDTYSYVALLDSGTKPQLSENNADCKSTPPTTGDTAVTQPIILDNNFELQGLTNCPKIPNMPAAFSLEFKALPALPSSMTGNDFYTECTATYYISFKNFSALNFSKAKSIRIDLNYIMKLYINYNFISSKIGVYADYLEFGTVSTKGELSLGSIGGYDISTKRENNKPLERKFVGIYDIQSNDMPAKLFVKIKSYYRNKDIQIRDDANTEDLEYFTNENSKMTINSIQLLN